MIFGMKNLIIDLTRFSENPQLAYPNKSFHFSFMISETTKEQ